MKKIVLYALFPTLLLLNGCRRPQAFDYREMKHLKLDQIGINKTVVSMNLVYYNPNNYGVTLKKIDCDIYLNQHFLGKYQLDTSMSIAKTSVFELPVAVSFNLKEFLKNGFSVLLNKEALVSVKGFTRVGKSGIYTTLPINYETKYKIPF